MTTGHFIKALFLGAVAGLSCPSFAQNNTGNGGRAIVCFSKPDHVTGAQTILSAKVTDLEESVFSRWSVSLGEDRVMSEADAYRVAKLAIEKIRRFDLKLANELDTIVTQMQGERKVHYWGADGLTLNRIRDANTEVKSIDENCLELQAAFNKTKVSPMEYRFVFVGNIIEKMTNRNFAALILHEALSYRESLLGATNSDGLRKLVRAVFSTEFNQQTSKDWYELATLALKQFLIREGDLQFYQVSQWLPDGRVKRGGLTPDTEIKQILQPACALNVSCSTLQQATVSRWRVGPRGADYARLSPELEGAVGSFYIYPGMNRTVDSRYLRMKEGRVVDLNQSFNEFDPVTLQPIQSLWQLREYGSDLSPNQPLVQVIPLKDRTTFQGAQLSRISSDLLVFISYQNGVPSKAIVFLSPSQWRVLWPKRLELRVRVGSSAESVVAITRDQGIEFEIKNHLIEGDPKVVDLPMVLQKR